MHEEIHKHEAIGERVHEGPIRGHAMGAEEGLEANPIRLEVKVLLVKDAVLFPHVSANEDSESTAHHTSSQDDTPAQADPRVEKEKKRKRPVY